ncbi:MAG: ATPase P [Nitrospirae bacterium]|nr:MAG: ATPase P [Nitrospirota bacterium]
MITIDVPGFGRVELSHLVSDFTGTLSEDGSLCEGVGERLERLSERLQIHILTADTFGTARKELEGINCHIHILTGERQDIQKGDYVEELGAWAVVAFGNGKNDRLMLEKARIGVAVCLKEGCAVDAMSAADIMVKSIQDGLDLLLNPKRLKATLRF